MQKFLNLYLAIVLDNAFAKYDGFEYECSDAFIVTVRLSIGMDAEDVADMADCDTIISDVRNDFDTLDEEMIESVGFIYNVSCHM